MPSGGAATLRLLGGHGDADTVATMASLSSVAATRLERINKRPRLPEWWELLGGGLVAVLVVVLAVGMMSSGRRAPSQSGALQLVSPAGATGPTTAGAVGASPKSTMPTQSPPTVLGGLVNIPATTGARTYTVARSAVQAARSAALATYTNNFTKVPLAPGSSPPQMVQSFPHAAIEKITVTSASKGTVLFGFLVAPFGPAAGGLRSLPVEVVDDSGSWVYPVPVSSGGIGG